MYINVICVDLNLEDRVPGVALTCTVSVAPRVLLLGVISEDPLPGGGATSLMVSVAKGAVPGKRIEILEEEAVTTQLPVQQAAADGEARFEVDLEPDYERWSAAYPPDTERQLIELAVFVKLAASIHGLERESEIVLNTVKSPTGSIGFDWEVVVGPDGPIELRPAPPPPPASSFPENLVELLPDYISDELDDMLPGIMSALEAAIEEVPPALDFPWRTRADDNDPAVKTARNTALARTQLLEFLSHSSFGATQTLMASIAGAFERREFDNAVTHVDELAGVPTDVPSITGGSVLLAMWPGTMEYPYLEFPPPEDQNDPVPPPIEVTGRLPGYDGPVFTITELMAFHELVAGGRERAFRVAVLRGEILFKLGERNNAKNAIEYFDEALTEYNKLLASGGVGKTRKKYVAIRAGYANLAKGDALFRTVRSPAEAHDDLVAAYDAGIAVVEEHGVPADNPLRQQIEKYAAVQKAKIEAGFNVLGFKDGYVPVLRAEKDTPGTTLYDLARDRIHHAAEARNKFIEFRERGNDLDDLAAEVVLESQIAAISGQIAEDRRDIAGKQRDAAESRRDAIVEGLQDLDLATQISATAGVLATYAQAAIGNGPGAIQSVEGLVSTGVGYFSRRNELSNQLRLARIEVDIADREETIAALEQEIADIRKDFLADRIKTLDNRFLNAELFHALANLYEDMADRSLEAAIRWVYLLERAVAFKRLDFDPPPFNFDYRDPKLGIIAAPENLLELVDEISERDNPSGPGQVLHENPILLRTTYPIEFNRLIQTGTTDFVISLYDLEKVRPDVFHRRLVKVEVELKGLIPEGGFAGYIEHEGFFVLRDRETTLGPPAIERLLPTEERMDEALQNLQRGHVQGDPVDGVIFYLLESNRQQLSGEPPPEDNNPEPSALALFEGHGETGRWQLHINPETIDLRRITDVLIRFTIELQSDGDLQDKVEQLVAAYEEEGSPEADLDKIAVFSLRQQFPDAYAALANGPAAFTLEPADFPSVVVEPRVKTVVGQVVDAEGSGVAGVGIEFTRVETSFSITRTTGDEGLTEAVDEEIPVIQPPDDRVPAEGTWEVRLADQSDFDRIDDLRLFLIYSFRPSLVPAGQ